MERLHDRDYVPYSHKQDISKSLTSGRGPLVHSTVVFVQLVGVSDCVAVYGAGHELSSVRWSGEHSNWSDTARASGLK